jgi:hypothetical protein
MEEYNKIKNKCVELNIDFNQFFILKSLHDNAEDDYHLIKNNLIKNEHKFNLDIEYLCKKEYICVLRADKQLSFIDVIKQQILLGFNDLIINKDKLKGVFDVVENVQSFCSRMYNKFPTGIKVMGYPVRSGESEFNKKLERFIKEHKFSLETIEIAFDLFIARAKQTNYTSGFSLAGYFVYKRDGNGSESSRLEAMCEEALSYKKEDLVSLVSGQTNLFSNDI